MNPRYIWGFKHFKIPFCVYFCKYVFIISIWLFLEKMKHEATFHFILDFVFNLKILKELCRYFSR